MKSPIPVILSGGSGTRLWPLSRQQHPKPLLRLYSELTLLQETVQRVDAAPLIVCHEAHRFIIAEQLREIDVEPRALIIEPEGRNTAPAAATAAMVLMEDDPDALMLVMPSDHKVARPKAFREAVERAVPLALDGMLTTFGVVPDCPHTGYGYLRVGAPLAGGFAVERFVEKPGLAVAQEYLASGAYLWNSGIFLFSARRCLEELARQAPEIVEGSRKALAEGTSDLFFRRLDAEAFRAMPTRSIDYAIMEHADRVAVIPVDIGWSDIGSWSALQKEIPWDKEGNAFLGDVIAIGARNSYVRSTGRLVAAVGVENLVVIATEDVVLVADKNHDQSVPLVVDMLKEKGRSEATQGPRAWRPWGWRRIIEKGERFQVRIVHVNPGARLGPQQHRHCSKHWMVVAGTASVVRGEEEFALEENESTLIPAGTRHRLENLGHEPLRLIEVQFGSCPDEEDDIARSDDVHRRL